MAITLKVFTSTTQFVDPYFSKEKMEARMAAFLIKEFSGVYGVAGFKPGYCLGEVRYYAETISLLMCPGLAEAE